MAQVTYDFITLQLSNIETGTSLSSVKLFEDRNIIQIGLTPTSTPDTVVLNATNFTRNFSISNWTQVSNPATPVSIDLTKVFRNIVVDNITFTLPVDISTNNNSNQGSIRDFNIEFFGSDVRGKYAGAPSARKLLEMPGALEITL